ncbi:MAG: 5-formyltetrahydrofolate cyclo-ligase [Verrucomicrobiales bacterium]
MDAQFPLDKPAWRREMKRRWRESCVEDRTASTAALAEALRLWLDHRPGGVLWFSPLPDEPDLRPLARELVEAGRRLALPRVTGEGLAIHEWNGQNASLAAGAMGILEPDPEKCPEIEPSFLAVAVIPGFAFDPQTGIRLGRGAGYYDRWFARSGFQGESVGLALPWQLAGPLPREEHDRPMGWLATSQGMVRPG